MKIYLLAALLGVFGLGIGASPAPRKHQKGDFLVGDKQCTWGPSYWCQNLTSAAGCQATQHCIQTVWEHQTYPTDHDNVCTICKDMVKQARDTLNSNETEEEIKEVFEGSCQLIHIKPIVKECIRIADEFAPQLIDALTSQMDPNTVCSVCGLCNNVAFDKMIAEAKKNEVKSPDLLHDEMMEDSLRQKCSNCVYVMDKVHSNLAATPEATFTKKLLTKCREMGSFSDSCSTLVVSHASSVYDFLLEKVKDEDACFLGGLCVGVKPYPLIQAVEVLPKAKLLTDGEQLEDDDLACDMCIALVDHFKQNLAANTTAIELKNVLLGICKNLRKFNTDCENLVESYYAKIYDYLKNGLVPKEVCLDVGICHNQVSSSTSGESEEINMQYIYANTKQPINPLIIGDILLPANLGLNTQQPEKKPSRPKIHSVPLEKDLTPGVLPVELYVPHADLATSQPLCTFCNYFLHFVQEEVTEPTNEKHIKDVIKSSCKRMPNQMYDECIQFVDQFGDTVVAMFVHQIDPSQICPSLHVCPTETNVEGKSCPLCLLAVKSIEDKLENNKTEENIKVTLENLCSHLPGDVRKECDTFIIEYFDDLIDMLVADFTPQEICTYLKLCNPPKLPGGDIATNEIYDGGDFQIFKEPSLKKDKPVGDEYCFFCTLIIDAIEKAAHDRNTDEQIKEDMMKVCKTLPGHMGKECSDFIRKYGDLIIDALINFTPKEVCQKIAVCVQAGIMNPSIYYMNQMVPDEKDDCKLCKKISVELKKLIEDTEEPMSIDEALKSVCAKLPFNVASHCQELIQSYGPSFKNVLMEDPNADICLADALCMKDDNEPHLPKPHLLGTNKCLYGPDHWCASTTNAAECNAISFCQAKIWKADKPQAKHSAKEWKHFQHLMLE